MKLEPLLLFTSFSTSVSLAVTGKHYTIRAASLVSRALATLLWSSSLPQRTVLGRRFTVQRAACISESIFQLPIVSLPCSPANQLPHLPITSRNVPCELKTEPQTPTSNFQINKGKRRELATNSDGRRPR